MVEKHKDKTYHLFFEHVQDVMYLLDANGVFLSLSPAFEAITGWSSDEWIGKQFTGLVHPDDVPRARELFQRLLSGEQLPVNELRVVSKSGDIVLAEFTSSPVIREGAVIGVFGIARDATQRRKRENITERKLAARQAGKPDGQEQASLPRRASKQVEQELARRNKQLSILNAISGAVSTSLDLREICGLLAHQLVEQLDFKSAFVFEYQEDAGVARLLAIFPRDSLLLKAVETLGLNLDEVVVPFRKEQNTVYARLLEGTDWVGNDFAELTTPYIPAIPARIAQKLYGVRSIHNAPIMSKGKLVGTIVVGSARATISEEERSIVLSVAQEVAPAIENARLFARVKRESTHRASLVEVTNAINSTVDVGKLLDLIVEKVLQLTHSKHGVLFLIDEEDETLRIKASRGLSDETIRSIRFKKGESIAGWVAQTGEAALIHSVQSHPQFKPVEQIERLLDIITVPLQVEGKIVGVLGMDRFEGENPFTEDEFRIAQDFANQASLALAKAKLFDDLQQKNRRLHKLHELSVKLTGDTQTIFDSITIIIAELFDVPIATIEELQEDSLTIRSMFLKGEVVQDGVYPLYGTPCQSVRNEKTTCLYTNASAQFPDDPFLLDYGVRTYLGVPVFDRGGVVIGVLNVMDHRVRSFTEEDRNLLSTFSERVFFELEEERRRKEREEMQRALQASETKYRKLFEDVPAGVYQSTPDGKVFAANPALVKMLGYDSETELQAVDIGKDAFVNPEEREMWVRKLGEHGVLQNVELTLKRKDGQQVTVLENTRVVRDEQGAVLYYEGTLIDITERKRAEEALRESENKLRMIVEHSTNLFYSHTADHVLTYLSPQTRTFLDCEPEEAMVQWTEFLTDNPVNELGIAATERAIQTGTTQPPYELELVGRKGRRIWVEVHESPVVIVGKTVAIVGSLTDVTERKRAAEALRKSEEHFRNLVENINDIYYVCDQEGRLTYGSPNLFTRTGYTREEIIGRSFVRLIHATDRHRVVDFYDRLAREGEKDVTVEFLARLKDGTAVWVEQSTRILRDEQGNVLEYRTIVRDITERKRAEEASKQAEEALRESEDRYRIIVEYMNEGLLLVDSNDVIQFVNDRFAQIVGYSKEELLGKVASNVVLHEENQEFMRDKNRLRTQGISDQYEIRLKRKSGETIWVLISGSPVTDAQGNVIGSVGIHTDITERRLAEQASKRAEQELERRHRTLQALSTVGRALTSSLDLNRVLSAIVQSVSELFHTSAAAVLLYDANANRLSIAAQTGYDERLVGDLRIDVPREGVTGLAVIRREPVYVPDVTKEPRYIKGVENVRSEFAIPLLAAGHVVGVLDVQDVGVDAFDADKINVLTQFADYAAVAVENARLFQQAQKQLKEMFIVAEIIRLSQSGLSFEELLNQAAEVIAREFQYYCFSVFLRENEKDARRICSFGEGAYLLPRMDVLPLNEYIVDKAMETGRPVLVDDLSKQPESAQWVGSATQARLCVPITRGDVVVGAFNVESTQKHAFTHSDVAALSNIAAQISVAEERTRLVEQIKASERKYMDLYENAPDIYSTQDENGVILICNETMAGTLGHSKEEIIGRSAAAFIPEKFHESCNEMRAKVLSAGAVSHYECQLSKKDGSVIDVEVHARCEQSPGGGRIIRVAMRDITEKKRTELELLHFANALSQTADSVIVTDRDGAIQYVNSAFEQTTGFTREEVVGQTPSILKSGGHTKEFYEEVWATLLAGRAYHGTFINRKKKGDIYYEEKTITPVKDRFGSIVNFVSAGRDVTEERRIEQHLAQAQKLESIGTLASGIVHDFNNVLVGISSYVELLKRHSDEREKAQRYTDLIQQMTQRGEDLTKQLLSFVRRDQQVFQSVNVVELIHEIALLGRGTFRKTIEIVANAGPEPLLVQGNKMELYQVLLNLCINARDAMPKGGTLSIAVEICMLPGGMRQSSAKPGSKGVRITVSDTGVGIPEAVMNKIFDPFFTTKEPGKGTGLGLSVAYNIVQNHNGLIDVISEEGQGTIFTIYLPAAEGKRSEESDPHLPPSPVYSDPSSN